MSGLNYTLFNILHKEEYLIQLVCGVPELASNSAYMHNVYETTQRAQTSAIIPYMTVIV